MNILICFKTVPDLDMVGDWTPDSAGEFDFSPVRRIWNCFDEGALEMALRFRDACGNIGGADALLPRLDALTIGDASGEGFLKTLAALGFDSVIRVIYDGFCGAESGARIIAAFVRSRSYQLVVMGAQSPVGNSGRTPLLTAEYLGWPYVAQCGGLAAAEPAASDAVPPESPAPAAAGALTIHSRTDEGALEQTVLLPCVVGVGNSAEAYLRVPTLRDRLTKGAKVPERYTPEALGITGSPETETPLVRAEPVGFTRQGVLLEEGTLTARVETLYHAYLKEKLRRVCVSAGC